MQYGQSIPPKTFFDAKPQFFTKQGFANYMARALQSVGMIPTNSVNSYDIANPGFAERDSGGNEDARFWFDYPTDDVFAVGGVAYRPCVGMLNCVYRGYSNYNITDSGKTFAYFLGADMGFKHFRRRADRIVLGDMKCVNNITRGYATNFGFGSYNGDFPGYHPSESGAMVGWSEWKLWESWADANMQQKLFVNRVFVHLGKAGLIVQVGTHPSRRDETCNIMNFAAVFHGGRVPNRSRPVIDDVLRDNCDPVAWFDLGAYSNSYFANSSRADMYTTLLGASRMLDGVVTEYPNTACYAFLRSIDYLDDGSVINAPSDVYPRPSPTVKNGTGVHLMHRACLAPWSFHGSSLYMGRVDSVKQPNLQSVYKWEDVFYLSGFALSDRVVPPGPRVDPNTGKNWYMIWSTPRGQAFGLDYDGTVTLPAFTAGAEQMTLMSTHALTLGGLAQIDPPYARTTTRWSDTWKNGRARTLLGVFGGVSVYASQFDVGPADCTVANRWRKPVGENGFTVPTWGYTTWDTTQRTSLSLEFEGLSTDLRDFYFFEYKYRARAPNSPGGNPVGDNYSYVYTYVTPGLFTEGTATPAPLNFMRIGTPAQQNIFYNYQTYGAWNQLYPVGVPDTRHDVDRFQPNSAGKASIAFDLDETGSYGGLNYGLTYAPTVDLRDFVLKCYRRS